EAADIVGVLHPLDQLVEPGEVRQQQPRIVLAARADQLAAMVDRLLYAVDRAVSEDLLGARAGQRERGDPGAGELLVAAAQAIGRLGREPDARAGGADVALDREVVE